LFTAKTEHCSGAYSTFFSTEMKTLLDTTNAIFSPELTRHLASRLGEGERNVKKATVAAVPMVMSGLIAKAAGGNAQTIFHLSQQAAALAPAGASTVTGVLGILGSGPAAGGAMRHADELLTVLFGAGKAALVEPISENARIKPVAAEALLQLVAAVVPALLAMHAAAHNWRAAELATALAGLRDQVLKHLPKHQPALLALLAPAQVEKKVSPSRGALGVVWQGVASVSEMPVRLGQGLLGFAVLAGWCAYLLPGVGSSPEVAKWALQALPAVYMSGALATTVEFARLLNFAW
jgi:hypothetical protein